MKFISIFICILLVGGITLFCVCKSREDKCAQKYWNNFLSKKYNFALFGDSHFEFLDYKKLLQQDDIINFGIRGETTRDMLLRMKPVIDSEVKHCLIMAGTNDCLYDFPVNTTINNLQNIFEIFKLINSPN